MSDSNNVVSIVEMNKFPKERFNVLMPVTVMQAVSNLQRIIVNQVQLEPDPTKGKDVYFDKQTNHYAITKHGASKLAAAAGIDVVKSESVKPDICVRCADNAKAAGKAAACGDCPRVYNVKYCVTVRVPEPSGGMRFITKSKEIDCVLEKESSTPGQYKNFLRHHVALCETKALMRCLRDALGIQDGYKTMEELAKPFMVARLVPNIDAPEMRERVVDSYLASAGLLFGASGDTAPALEAPPSAPPAPALPAPEQPADGAPSTPPTPATAPAPAPAPADADAGDLPWAEPTPSASPDAAAPAKVPVYCHGCGVVIEETVGKDGKAWTPEDIRAFSEKKYGTCMCVACMHTDKTIRRAQ